MSPATAAERGGSFLSQWAHAAPQMSPAVPRGDSIKSPKCVWGGMIRGEPPHSSYTHFTPKIPLWSPHTSHVTPPKTTIFPPKTGTGGSRVWGSPLAAPDLPPPPKKTPRHQEDGTPPPGTRWGGPPVGTGVPPRSKNEVQRYFGGLFYPGGGGGKVNPPPPTPLRGTGGERGTPPPPKKKSHQPEPPKPFRGDPQRHRPPLLHSTGDTIWGTPSPRPQ